MNHRPSSLVISLDFELHWGVCDHLRVEDYRANLLGVREAIPAMLALFQRYDLHATWATVGFLFAETRRQLLDALPAMRPTYDNPRLSPYGMLSEIGENERADPFHFAPSLLRQIAATRHQELGTHTFSHYYCLEPGQSSEAFEADLHAAAAIGRDFGPVCQSLVFPRNQFNPAYLPVMQKCGVRAYRGNGPQWAPKSTSKTTALLGRAIRLLDTYVPLTGNGTAPKPKLTPGPVDVPASTFLRPYNPRLRPFDSLRRRRITSAMTAAAHRGESFHLWWHPHNFGVNLRENLAFLTELLEHFMTLRRRYEMQSFTMGEAAVEAKASCHAY